MSASLYTAIEMEGTLEEITAMITVIKDYCGCKHDASLDYPKICLGNKFDYKNAVLLKTLSEESLAAFLAKHKGKVFVMADGPYGSYGRVDEAGLFEAIAEAAPSANFQASTTGFTTGQSDDFTGDLKNGKLYLTYSCLPDDCKISDDDDEETNEEWFTEKITYDPQKKEYEKENS